MSVIINLKSIGAEGVNPREWAIFTDNTVAEVTADGFLTQFQSTYNFMSSDYAQVYTTDAGAIQLAIDVSDDSEVSLYSNASQGIVNAPVSVNYLAVFSSTTGELDDTTTSSAHAVFPGILNLGTNAGGFPGGFNVFPTSANKGYLWVAAANNTSDVYTKLTNAAMNQNTVITIPDPATTAANLLLSTGPNTLTKVNGTEASNAVTASGISGVITTSSLTTAGAASYAITWTNTYITSTSVITLTVVGGTNTTQNYRMSVVPGSGTATLTIYNNTASTAFNGTILIGYTVW